MAKKIVMVIASEQFRDEEYLEPKNIFTAAGFEVITASAKLGTAKGKLGLKAKVDILLSDVKPEDYEAVIFVGGPGCYDYYSNQAALRLAKSAAASSKIVASICSAGGILAHAGVLEGKKATIFPGEAELLKTKGAIYTAAPLEIDGQIFTADGPGSAKKFGESIKKALTDGK